MARACIVCGATEKLRSCSRCKQVRYCGKEHQLAHWKEHKATCAPLKPGSLTKRAATPATTAAELKPPFTEAEVEYYGAMPEIQRSMELGYKASSAWGKIASGSATAEDYATHSKYTALERHFNC